MPESTKLTQLQAACDEPLRQRVFDTGLYNTLTSEKLFLDKMEELAVIKVHKSVHLRNLWKMIQQPEEPIRAYVARLTATADMCDMKVTCTCAQEVPYRDNVIQQLVINGMRDSDIRIRVLSRNTNGELVTLDKLVNYIQAEEAGRNESSDLTAEDGNVNGIRRRSEYQKEKSRCHFCGQAKHTQANTPEDRKTMCKAFGNTCSRCQKKNHFPSVCKSPRAKVSPVTTDSTDTTDTTRPPSTPPQAGIFTIGAQTCQDTKEIPTSAQDLLPTLALLRQGDRGPVTTLPLPHHVHDSVAGWIQTKPQKSPTIQVHYSVDRQAYGELHLPMPRLSAGPHPGRSSSTVSVCDTGAQLTVIPRTLLANMQVKSNSIFPIQTQIHGVSNAPVIIDGGVLLKLTSTNPTTGATRTSHQLAYVSGHVSLPYLSFSTCVDLGIIAPNFPQVGSSDNTTPAMVTAVSPTQCTNSGVPTLDEGQCSCPRRELPPPPPTTLPFPPTVENLPRLKQFILDRYASSAFNCCERQPLKLMDKSPPLRIFTDAHAKPKAVHTPSVVPLHWKAAVKQGLERDERLGVIERVPVNTPVDWCSRMVVTAKSDGSPRRVVDYTELNKHTPRQTHHTPSPWTIASSIPPNKVKSTLDCWHGYHSVPLHPADRPLTTFITEEGRFRYRTVPQGLISAGDAYTQRKAEIMTGIPDQSTCVDDTILFDDNIEQNFNNVCEFLTTGANGGCTFNPKKFQFGEEEVEFLGFLITKSGVKTTQKFRDSILNFPTPQNITDVRSWFGCINQVSYSFASAPIMSPFRHLLSSKVPFAWSEELQMAFEASKQEIVDQCEKGVRSFNPALPTALATDWSKLAIGFWLTQKHCKCTQITPGCCPTGWQTVYCGSKFCTPAESRYHPIVGEALAATYGLQKCKFFVLGLDNLILTLDHKPLISIFGNDRALEEIENPRLLNFKLQAMKFKFKVMHIPGKKNVTADALSRRHDSPISELPKPRVNCIPDTDIPDGYSSNLGPPAWVSPPTSVGPIHQAAPLQAGHERAHHQDGEVLHDVLPIPATLANLHALPQHCEEQLSPEHVFVGNIMSALASINSWSRSAPITMQSQPTALSWERLEAACLLSEEYKLLLKTVRTGTDRREDWDEKISDFYQHRRSLVAVGPVVLLHDRPVIPRSLQQAVLAHLHAGHQGANSMFERASTSLFWPNYRADIINYRAACAVCSRYQPSNPAMPAIIPESPAYPFQSICADFFTLNSFNYLIIIDRYSNWLSVFRLDRDTSEEFLKILREYIAIFGIPTIFTSDGAKVFTSKAVEEFCDRYGIVHRVTTAYNARSNKRAEVGVKSAKRMLRDNLSQTGSLNTNKMIRAILQHHNTPCPITGLSPAQVIFGRVFRDSLSSLASSAPEKSGGRQLMSETEPTPGASWRRLPNWTEAPSLSPDCSQVSKYRSRIKTRPAGPLSSGQRQEWLFRLVTTMIITSVSMDQDISRSETDSS